MGTPDALQLAQDPRGYFGSAATMFATPYREVQELQRDAMQTRLDELAHRIPALQRRVAETGVTRIENVSDVVPLMFSTSVYKSYPMSWLETYDFVKLTNWLRQFSIHDLSQVDLTGCTTLDDWMDALDAQTELRVCHSSATSGKMSFLPRSVGEWDRRAMTNLFVGEQAGRDTGSAHVSFAGLPILTPFYRYGRSAFMMNVEWNVRVFGNPEDVVTMYPGRMSSDLLLLAGRLRSQNADVRAVELPEAARRRLTELEAMVDGDPDEALDGFLAEATRRFGGRQVFMIGVAPMLLRAATRASITGDLGTFAPDSHVHTGGGGKGTTLPDDWQRTIAAWMGVPEVRETYGMSEVMGASIKCMAGYYHINPWTVPFVLDPDTLAPIQGDGTRRGLLACFDLMAASYWGGMVSTDVVNLSMSPDCACGRVGPYLSPLVERAEVDGDEKISCAATPGARDEAIAFLKANAR